MQSFKLSMLGAIMLSLNPGPAPAAGFYLGAQGGMNLSYDAEVDRFGGSSSELSYDPGFAIGFAGGYSWPVNLRTEIELAFRQNELDSIAGLPVSDGVLWSLALMVNVFYDFDTGTDWIPYVGGGLGLVSPHFDSSLGTHGAFGYQIGTGIGYAISPSVILSLDYRLFGTFGDAGFYVFDPEVDLEYLNSTFLVGLRYQF